MNKFYKDVKVYHREFNREEIQHEINGYLKDNLVCGHSCVCSELREGFSGMHLVVHLASSSDGFKSPFDENYKDEKFDDYLDSLAEIAGCRRLGVPSHYYPK